MYAIEGSDDITRIFFKLAKKNKAELETIYRKLEEVVANPHHFKPLRAPMQNKRRVHIGSFVLIFRIDENRRKVLLLDYDHHDKNYRC